MANLTGISYCIGICCSSDICFRDCNNVWFVGDLNILILLFESFISTLVFDLLRRALLIKCKSNLYISITNTVYYAEVCFFRSFKFLSLVLSVFLALKANYCLRSIFLVGWRGCHSCIIFQFLIFLYHGWCIQVFEQHH